MKLTKQDIRNRKTNEEAPSMPFENCCAKSTVDGGCGTSVFDHCRYAGCVAERFCLLLPECVRENLPSNVGFLVALHDIGKVSPWFQGKYFIGRLNEFSPDWARKVKNLGSSDGSDHATVGARAYMDMVHVDQINPIVRTIALHHGFVRSSLLPNTDGQSWQRERERLVNALAKYFGAEVAANNLSASCTGILSGLTCVADWIASNEEFFPADGKPIDASALSDYVKNVLLKLGFVEPVFRRNLKFSEMFDGYEPRSEQRSFLAAVNGPGVYVMEATMGAGKTEAALAVAYGLIASGHNNGIYFALPTRLTSDRIYLRMQRFLNNVMFEEMPIRLSHGRAWLDNYQICGTGAKSHQLPSWFAPSKRGLLYPFAVGTVDQALLAAMNVRHSFVRLFGLAGKVVILDEVHSYDMYTGSLVAVLVRYLREVGCSVIILSATLTKSQRDALLGCATPDDAPYPLVTGNANGRAIQVTPKADAVEKRIAINSLVGVEMVISDALAKARRGCNVLCVANTVRQSQRWYRALKQQMDESDAERIRIGLLHSRFPEFRRDAIEADWMSALGKGDASRPTGSIFIATQIVEQSVDIDADYLITEIAPIDMLFQRMGRLWRHERGRRPICEATCALAYDGIVPNLDDFTEERFCEGVGMGSCCVYAPYVLLRTLQTLSMCTSLSIPGDMRSMIEAVYSERAEVDGSATWRFKKELDEKKKEMKEAALSAEARVTALPTLDDSDDAPPTRYGSRKTVSLLLVRSCDCGIGRDQAELELLDGQCLRVNGRAPDFAVTRAIYSNTVAVPVRSSIGSLERSVENRLLCCHFHIGSMPLLCRVSEDGIICGVGSGERIGLSYREDIGLFEDDATTEAGICAMKEEEVAFDFEGTDW